MTRWASPFSSLFPHSDCHLEIRLSWFNVFNLKRLFEFPLTFSFKDTYSTVLSKVISFFIFPSLEVSGFCLWVRVVHQYFSWVSWVGVRGEIVTNSLHICIHVLPVVRWMISCLDGAFLVVGLSSHSSQIWLQHLLASSYWCKFWGQSIWYQAN